MIYASGSHRCTSASPSQVADQRLNSAKLSPPFLQYPPDLSWLRRSNGLHVCGGAGRQINLRRQKAVGVTEPIYTTHCSTLVWIAPCLGEWMNHKSRGDVHVSTGPDVPEFLLSCSEFKCWKFTHAISLNASPARMILDLLDLLSISQLSWDECGQIFSSVPNIQTNNYSHSLPGNVLISLMCRTLACRRKLGNLDRIHVDTNREEGPGFNLKSWKSNLQPSCHDATA